LIAPRHLAPCMLDLLERSTAIVGALAARCATCAGLCGLVRAFVRTDGSRNPPCSVGPATEPDVRARRGGHERLGAVIGALVVASERTACGDSKRKPGGGDSPRPARTGKHGASVIGSR